MSEPFSLADTYLHLRPDDSVVALEGGDAFWRTVAARRDLDQGRLLTAGHQSKDWPHWERHPAGEEILVLLSGAIEVVLDLPGGERRAAMTPGQALVVPTGIWHRAIVRTPGAMLFATPGRGTEHRPL